MHSSALYPECYILLPSTIVLDLLTKKSIFDQALNVPACVRYMLVIVLPAVKLLVNLNPSLKLNFASGHLHEKHCLTSLQYCDPVDHLALVPLGILFLILFYNG